MALTSNKGVVGIIGRREVGHLRGTAIGIFPLCKELVDGIKCIGLNGIIGGEDDELRRIGLHGIKMIRKGTSRKGCIALTGLIPPGGLVLAQLQVGSLHFEGSQEYPKASGLVVAPSMPPS